MRHSISRRQFLTTTAASLAAFPAFARAPEVSLRPSARPTDLLRRIQPDPQDLISNAQLGGDVGFVAIRGSDGALLEAGDAENGLPPASVAKALTACYAIETLGPDHRFATRILVDGKFVDGRVEGNVILAGGADPTLSTDDLAELARMLKAAGIFEVTGAFHVWGGQLPYAATIDAAQPEQVGYNPAVSGLNLNFNRVHFEWRKAGSSYTVTMDARSANHRPEVSFARMDVVARDVPVYTYKDGNGRDNWTVARGALGNGGARWLPVRKPELYAGEVFQTFARAHGIALKPPKLLETLPESTEVARVESAPLRQIAVDMLKFSTNLTAETIGMAATTARGGRPDSIRASADAMNAWLAQESGATDFALVDHSGLGDTSRISTQTMAKALRLFQQRIGIKALMKPFPFRDDKGRQIKDHTVSVLSKTGTLNFVSGLAGFADYPDGTEVVFAIFCADIDRRAGLSRAERKRPEGAASWNRRAKQLQQALIERWGVMYTS